jgi:hypothetical protein
MLAAKSSPSDSRKTVFMTFLIEAGCDIGIRQPNMSRAPNGVLAAEITTAVCSFIGFPMRKTLRIVPTVLISRTLRHLHTFRSRSSPLKSERNHVADGVGSQAEHGQAIKTQRDSRTRRKAVLHGGEQSSGKRNQPLAGARFALNPSL